MLTGVIRLYRYLAHKLPVRDGQVIRILLEVKRLLLKFRSHYSFFQLRRHTGRLE